MAWLARDGKEIYHGNLAEPLLDDELWAPLMRAIREAQRSIDLSQLFFEEDFSPLGEPLCRALTEAAARGARVRLLVNENAAIPDSYDEMRAFFAASTAEVRALTMSPNVLHAKLLVADDEEAFLIDAPFESKYVDTSAHPYDDAQRKHHKPFHAVSLRLRGPAVPRVADVFESLWRGSAGVPPPPLPARPAEGARAGAQSLQLAWTSPAGILEAEPVGAVLDAYERALAAAREYAYIETQYFTSPRIRDAISRALAREPRLEVILVLNTHMDVPTYDAWQAKRLGELGFPDHPRLGVFALWSPRRAGRDVLLRQVYVHSKVAMVDDKWATIGSANLDSISLHDADEFGIPFPRNAELNAILLDGIEGAPATGAVARLRRRLWGEHLGDQGVWRADPPPGGWLAHWRRVADDNLTRFEQGAPPSAGRVFPFGALTNDRRQAISGRREAHP